NHQKLKFFRNERWKSGIAIKIILVIFIFYLISVSFQVNYFILEFKPDAIPVDFMNNYLIYLFMIFLLSGLIMQKIPFEKIQYYLHLNIRKKWIVNFLLFKTVFGNKTLIVIALFTPFTFVSVTDYYSLDSALLWLLNTYLVIFCINLLVQLLKLIFQINIWYQLSVILIVFTAGLAKYLTLINPEKWSTPIFGYMFNHPLFILTPMIIFAILYVLNYQFLKNSFYYDNLHGRRRQKSKPSPIDLLNWCGDNKELIRYNIRQILRNKKCRIQYIFVTLFSYIYSFLLYDLLANNDGVIFGYLFSLFVFSFFWINYLSLFFAWDTHTLDFIHSANINTTDYIFSKINAVILVSLFHYLPGIGLIYFIPEYFRIIISVILIQFGIFTFFIVYVSMFGILKMDINKSPFLNYEGASAIQFLIMFPLIIISIIPIIIFYRNPHIGYTINAFIGLGGLMLSNIFVKIINKKYQKDKYIILNELR
ncbi:MAG: DUF5687 family protein, partial [Fidelibacterota bacterium]